MSEPRHEAVHRLFTEAVALPPEDRWAFLEFSSGRDGDLRAEVDAMLAEDGRTGQGFDAVIEGGGALFLAAAMSNDGDDVPGPDHPERIGRYRIVRRIGAGGMGVVYEAEQDDPKRRVALKVMRCLLRSRQMVWRFRREVQVLGHLRHHGIAQIYEAGEAHDGEDSRPYFSMELVEGKPLDRYAAAHDLGTAERLDLIARLCDVLDYAHKSGVIHRDLKPSNILVTTRSAEPSLKVLDFGVARITDVDPQSVSVHTGTGTGTFVGTVPYMSPEQASGDPDAIDSRSDIYAVGVTAFQLLAGTLPYDLTDKMVHEMAWIIREGEPTRLASIDRRFRGDVEAIVSKAMEKDPSRRYASAAGLAEDIRRHLDGQPITARLPSAGYRLRKLIQRHRPLSVASGVVVAGAIMLTASLFSPVIRHEARGLAPQTVTPIRFADAWLAANPGAEAYSFDQFYPGRQPGTGCLTNGAKRVTLALEGETVTVSSHDASGKPICPIQDQSSFARVSDATIAARGMLTMEFDPPITAFYAMFGSLASEKTVSMELFAGGAFVDATTSAASKRNGQGHGFVSTTPVDRIEFTTTEAGKGAVLLGAFRYIQPDKPTLGIVNIPGYGGQYGDDVYLDFAYMSLASAAK